MKYVLKILLVLVIVVLVFGVGFILALQIFEYRPADHTNLTIQNNLDDNEINYVNLETTLKVMTFNTGYASLSATEDFVMDGGEKGRMDSQSAVEANMAGIESILLRESADIYLIQEVDVNSSRSYELNQYEYYQNALGTSSVLAYNYRCIFVPFPLNPSQMMGKVNSGIATYSNLYSDSAVRDQLPGSFSWPLRLANLKRAIMVQRFPIKDSDKELVVINVHMSAYDDGTMRIAETEYLQSVMLEETNLGNYVIVGGDFNQTLPGAYTKTYIGNGDTQTEEIEYLYTLRDPNFWQAPPIDAEWFTENNFQFGIDTSYPTCRLLNHPYDTENPLNNQYYLIDGFIVSPNITIQLVETLNEDFQYSDHNPVIMQFKLNS